MIRRALAVISALAMLACQTPPDPQTSPESSPSVKSSATASAVSKPIPLLSPSAKPSPCVQQCLDASQMQARAWEAIVEDCKKSCQSR